MKRFLLPVVFFCLVCLVAAAGSARAQEARATLTGRVTDSTGAVVPHARIVVTNTDTGAKTDIFSNGVGEYTVPFLQPGVYEIAVSAKGFKSYVHLGITLQTEQTVAENVSLAVGEADQTVTVTAASPLVDTQTASTGQVLTAEEVEDLPSNGRSPLGFAHLEYGAVPKGKHSEAQVLPFQNTAADDFSLGGGDSSSNELLLNGVPNMESSQRVSGFSPELDSVDAVRVDEFDTSAANGDTSGGTVNITTKAGTNTYHGSISEYYADQAFNALPYFTPKGSIVPSVHYNQFGGTIGGPVRFPHFNGRDKLFFFYAFEGYIGSQPGTTITAVPTAAERNGDFSALLAADPNDQLYNPYGATLSNGVVNRNPIPGNVLANADLTVSPIAKAYFAQIPLPNYNGATTQPDGENNFFANDPTVNDYKSNMGRIDWNIAAANKIYFEAHRSSYIQTGQNLFNNPMTGFYSKTILWGGVADDVHNFSPTLNFENRLGFSRWDSLGAPSGQGINPTTYGFPPYIAANSTSFSIPPMTLNDNNNIPQFGGSPGNLETFDNIQYFASLNKTWGRHNLKIGPDIRSNKDTVLNPGDANGSYSFSSNPGDFVSQNSNANAQDFGGSFALFELGLADGGASNSDYQVNTRFQYDNWYTGLFIQDDWKAKKNFTVSMGLRFEHETPVVEGHNNMVIGWNPSQANAVTTAAAAAYASTAHPALSPSSISPTGGIIYATPGHRSAYSTALAYVSPRIGIAYSPDFSHGRMAVRIGFGVYDNPFNDYLHGQQYGYSQTTGFIATNNNYLTPAGTISDPFPVGSNPIELPFGSSLGINTNLGNSIAYYSQVKVPYSQKWSFDVEQQVGKSWLFEVGYLGTHQVHQGYNNSLSALPLNILSTSPFLDPVLTAELNKPTPNPFLGIVPGPQTGLNTAKTLSVASLLNAYPEYSSVTEQQIPGASENFNAILAKVTKQMSNGLQFNFNFEYSRQLGAASQLNPGGPLWYGETGSDFPVHASLTAIYQLPFGSGQRFLHNNRLVDELIGGYTLSTIYQYLSGTPLQWGNTIYTGNYTNFNNQPHKTNGPSFNTAGFLFGSAYSKVQPNGYNYRTFPLYLLRSDPTNNLDVSLLKNFVIFDRLIIQPRFDAFNALNRAQFTGENLNPKSSAFGDINKQLNQNRQLQGGIHFLF